MHKIFSLSCLVCLIFSQYRIAHSSLIEPLDLVALSSLEKSDSGAILSVREGDIYLNSKNIVVREDGIFLSIDDDVLFSLPSLHSDQQGIYTRVSETDPSETLASLWLIVECSNCHFKFIKTFENMGVCPKCGTSN